MSHRIQSWFLQNWSFSVISCICIKFGYLNCSYLFGWQRDFISRFFQVNTLFWSQMFGLWSLQESCFDCWSFLERCWIIIEIILIGNEFLKESPFHSCIFLFPICLFMDTQYFHKLLMPEFSWLLIHYPIKLLKLSSDDTPIFLACPFW